MTDSRITIECPECEGDGVLTDMNASFCASAGNVIADPIDVECERCDGSGEVEPDPECGAGGTATAEKFAVEVQLNNGETRRQTAYYDSYDAAYVVTADEDVATVTNNHRRSRA